MIQQPLFKAKSEWCAPTEFPDLSLYEEIAIDLETKDPDLTTKGSCSTRGGGDVVGIAVAVKDWCGYYPIGHEGGGNLNRKKVLKWFTDILQTPAMKIFHNAMYDVLWIKRLGLTIHGTITDTMVVTALVNENRFRFDLNSVAKEYTGMGKNEASLQEAAKEWGIDPKAEMYKLPSLFVGEYAEKDAEITLALWQELKKEIKKQNLHSILELETNVLPCLVEMKWRGVRVDEDHVEILEKKFKHIYDSCLKSVKEETGIFPEIWAARSIAKVCEQLGIEDYERTPKTQAPSFTKNWLSNHPHRTLRNIASARNADKLRSTFIETIKNYVVNGKIHADINQLKGDQGGTLTGRLSYARPNLQQLPNYNDYGEGIRSIFLPNSKNERWGCFDYSQQEPRLVVHYALRTPGITGINEIAQEYKAKDSTADFHQLVAKLANIERKEAKTINLGLFYGMGQAKLQAQLGINSETEAKALINKYHFKVPFVKQLMTSVMHRAQNSGQIRTIGGRLCRFNKWEPKDWDRRDLYETWDEAARENGPGNIKRAFTYKALNRLIQGSAADMTKQAMINLFKANIIPLTQLHDELNISIESPEQVDKIRKVMKEAFLLEIPNKVDYEDGENWGSIDKEEENPVDKNFF
jgi:DNA polymerase I-like protein with 3'-5' exonuclease and polymerase domains|tara:strand:+ start:36 stop:1946 length:1911 start_codon:yes stop_codon:yes gene_type:complete